MGILNAIKNCLNSSDVFENKIMKSIDKPKFLKDFSKETYEIKELEELLGNVIDENKKKYIEKDIYMLKRSIDGHGKVYFELKNSEVPYFGLYDLRIQCEDNISNIDFLLVTHRFFCIIKNKSINGNIEIDSKGNFNIWYKKDEKWHKEGIYSPVEQNRRAENVVKSILANKFDIHNMPVYSLVVFTNPKMTINSKEAPKDIEKQVIRLDAINSKLKELVNETKYDKSNEIEALKIAEHFISINTPLENDWNKKYGLEENIEIVQEVEKDNEDNKVNREDVVKALKEYRLRISKDKNIPPYYVFNNEEMDRLVENMPKTKEELLKIRGFGEVKIERYGEEILEILNS